MRIKTVIVLGASSRPERYSNKAVRMLKRYGHRVIAVGIRKGEIDGIPLRRAGDVEEEKVHTVSVYLSPPRQKEYRKYLKKWKPERVIFNPGTENDEWKKVLNEEGVEVVDNCTLVMLQTGLF